MNFNDAFNEQERRIISGYLTLMSQKPYTKITVKELTSQCGIARTTFYRSFEDTYDLLEKLERYLLGELVLYRRHMSQNASGSEANEHETTAPVGEPYRGIEHLLKTGIRLRFLLRVIMGENGDPYFKERLIKRLETELSQMMDDERAPNDELRPYYIAAISASYIGLLRHIANATDDELLPASTIADVANAMRIAYFKTGPNPPAITDERLFG